MAGDVTVQEMLISSNMSLLATSVLKKRFKLQTSTSALAIGLKSNASHLYAVSRYCCLFQEGLTVISFLFLQFNFY